MVAEPLAHRSTPSRRVVLIGDDNAHFRSSLAELLEEEGLEVAEAADGRDVIDTARERNAGLLLLDVRMPRLSGLEAWRALREAGLLAQAIFMTTGPTPQLRLEARRLGAVAMLDKLQLRIAELRQLVQALLRPPDLDRVERIEAMLRSMLHLLLDPEGLFARLRALLRESARPAPPAPLPADEEEPHAPPDAREWEF